MRVSNDTLRSAFLAALDDARRRVVETQHQVSTGLRINSPSDDPVAAARVAHLDASLARLDQYQANAIFARNQLGLEEESLSEAIGHLQRIRELTLQANNGSASSGDRQVIASEIRQHRDGLLALANTTDVDGRHLFAGYRESATPFTVAAGGSVVYNGDQGQRTLQISDSRFVAINDSGADVFQRIPEGNGTFVARRQRREHGHRNARLEQRRRILRAGSPTPTRLRFSRRRATRCATAPTRSSSRVRSRRRNR